MVLFIHNVYYLQSNILNGQINKMYDMYNRTSLKVPLSFKSFYKF